MRLGVWLLLAALAAILIAVRAGRLWVKVIVAAAGVLLLLGTLMYCLSLAQVNYFGTGPDESGMYLMWRLPWERDWRQGFKVRL